MFAFAVAAANAQVVAPAQITPSQLTPPRGRPAAIALPEAPGLAPPANAASFSITLGSVVVEGGFDDMAGQTHRITDAIVGRAVTVADVYAAAGALESAYGAAGYALARIVVPPQKLDPHGRLKLIVVDGYVGKIDVSHVPERQRAVISARLAPLIGKRRVKLGELERRVLLAGDVAGLRLKSTLAAGAKSGGADLVLDASERLVTGSWGVDNNLPRQLDNWEITRSLQINSPLGLGEQFYLTAITGWDVLKVFDGTTPTQILGGGLLLPLGDDGWTINPEYTNAITRPLAGQGAPSATGYFQRADLRASYPLIRTRAETLTLSGALEWDQENMRPTGFPIDLYQDNYFVWRGKADSVSSLEGGMSLETSGVLSQGLGGRTGAGSVTPLSQQGASPYFTKFYADGRWSKLLPDMFSLALFSAGQTSFGRPLMISEQMSLDGPVAVSGYPTGVFVVDEGAYARAELGKTLSFTTFGTQVPVEPYVFGAGAFGVIDQPTVVQQGALRLGSVGLGTRATFNTTGLVNGADFGVEVARYFSNVPNERAGWRGNLQFSVRF